VVLVVRASGLPHETNSMFTNIEGEWDEIMPVTWACIEQVAESASRVTVTIKLDWRPGQPDSRLSRDVEAEPWWQADH
jgi:uncharacterized protein YqgV (UPF0045/DUF77 family)